MKSKPRRIFRYSEPGCKNRTAEAHSPQTDFKPRQLVNIEPSQMNVSSFINQKEPNHALETTTIAVTDCAFAHSAPAMVASHL